MLLRTVSEWWPLALTAGTGLVAWGDMRRQVSQIRREVDTKASREVLEQIDARLTRIENLLDRLVERN